MANTLKKISTVTVGSGGAANIEFTNIPQTYTDLKLVVSARGTQTFANSGNFYTIRPNGLNTNLSGKYLISIGTSVATGSYQPFGYMSASDYTASVFGSGEHYIPNYTSANYKSFSSDDTGESNASIMYATDINAGLWSSTSAITSLTLVPGGGNFAQYSTATLYGISNANTTAGGSGKATGGNQVYTDGTYWYHVFTSDGNFVPSTSMNVDYLVVAGGGGGGGGENDNGAGGGGAGGGAGGVRCTVGATGGGGSLESTLAVTAQTYAITVGAGGAGGASNNTGAVAGTSGSNSVFSTITSTGGGGGGREGGNGLNGGSGGGRGGDGTAAGTGTTNQGYAGGGVLTGRSGGGGGGANAIGSSGTSSAGGAGGAGITTSISGTSTTYAGGGGGGGGGAGGTGIPGGAGGSGGGGAGSTSTAAGVGSGGNTPGSGTVNTGSGAGGTGAGNNPSGGTGGSGIVIVRYAA